MSYVDRRIRAKFRTASTIAAAAIFAIFCTTGGICQQAVPWTRIASSRDGFSAVVPPEIIIIVDGRDYTRLILSTYEVRLEISRQPNRGQKDSALRMQPGPSDTGQNSTFKLGDVVGRVNISERPRRSATRITASSEKYLYTIAAYSRRPDHPILLSFLASLRFGGDPLLKTPSIAGDTLVRDVEMSELQNSPIVDEYLAKPARKNVDVSYEAPDPAIPFWAANFEPTHDYENETRSLIVLRVPKPEYRPTGVRVSGGIKVQVTLLSTGQVGSIVVDPQLDRGLAKSAAEAAKQIKFIPAELRGQLIDVKRTFIYSFMSR
jgi:hypothetical protein